MGLFQSPQSEWALTLESNQRKRVVRLMSEAIAAILRGGHHEDNEPSSKDHGAASDS